MLTVSLHILSGCGNRSAKTFMHTHIRMYTAVVRREKIWNGVRVYVCGKNKMRKNYGRVVLL